MPAVFVIYIIFRNISIAICNNSWYIQNIEFLCERRKQGEKRKTTRFDNQK